MTSPVFTPLQMFYSTSGLPLTDGYIYIGTASQNPQTNPIAVYWDAAGTIPAAQPIRTSGGYPVRNGSPATVFVLATDFSLIVRDKSSKLVFSRLSGNAFSAEWVTYTPAGTGAVVTTVQAKLRESVSVEDFGADPTGVADSTQAFSKAVTAIVALGGGVIHALGKQYLLNGGTASPDGYKNGVLIPFGVVNADPSTGIEICGGGSTVLKCGSNNMILVRNSRNCTTLRDLTLDYNGKTGVYLCLTGPEDMTQTTTLVSNSFATFDNVSRLGGAGVDGLVFMPGPYVGGSDSGAFYHNVIGGYSNFIGGGRHIWARKNVNWASFPNWITRTNFIGQRLTRGNVGYHFEDGSECTFQGCNEEAINSGVTPIATPTARVFESPCNAMQFYGGYSESCTLSVSVVASDCIESWGYKPASGSDTAWTTNAMSWADGANDNRSWTPVVVSSGGGAQGASTSFGRAVKQGKMVFLVAQISVAKGTLGAGSITITGAPYISDASWTSADFQGLPVTKWSGVTLGAGWTSLGAYISGASISIRKLHDAGAGTALLTVAECSDPIVLTVQGWYKVA